MKQAIVTGSTNRCGKLLLAVSLGCGAVGVGSADAAALVFTPGVTETGDSDVLTAGTLFQAIQFTGSDVTVNGVTFASGSGVTVNGNGDTASQGNFTFSNFRDNNGGAFNSGSLPFAAFSAGYQQLLRGALYDDPGQGSSTITVSNLTPGDSYELQFFVNDPRGSTRSETLAGTTPATLLYGAGVDGTPGQFTLGTFVADSTGTQSFTLTQGDANSTPQVNALQVRDLGVSTPEPASLGLLGVAGLGLLARRRRVQDCEQSTLHRPQPIRMG